MVEQKEINVCFDGDMPEIYLVSQIQLSQE